MKARGLTKLRFYCQICQKANRDEHAYKMHCESESHMRQLAIVAQNPDNAIDDFSKQFLDEFVSLLSRRFGTRRIKANQVYQEYIQERHHLHMNATRWVTLSEFVKHLGREGIAHVEEDEKGWFISWVDNSPAALKRQAALQKMERQKMDDEGRERKRLQEQIAKAKREEESKAGSQQPGAEGDASNQGVLRRDQGPIKLGVSLKGSKSEPSTSSSTPTSSGEAAAPSSGSQETPSEAASKPTTLRISSSSSSSAPAPRIGVNPLKLSSSSSSSAAGPKVNPLKAAAAKSASGSAPKPRSQEPRTMAERIRLEEEEQRKKRKSGPMPSANNGIKRIRM